jgi:hypothetical protein
MSGWNDGHYRQHHQESATVKSMGLDLRGGAAIHKKIDYNEFIFSQVLGRKFVYSIIFFSSIF